MKSVRLHLNENPFSLPNSVAVRVVEAIESINEYPLGMEDEIIDRVAKFYDLSPEHITLTAGVDDAIDRVIVLCNPDKAFCWTPGFDGFWKRARALNQTVDFIDQNEDDSWDLATEPRDSRGNDLAFVASTSNPCGDTKSERSIYRIIERFGFTFIDRTYDDYRSDDLLRFEEPSSETFQFSSFSKSFGLAGLRIGMLVTDKRNTRRLREYVYGSFA